jgi:hypothetical protein
MSLVFVSVRGRIAAIASLVLLALLMLCAAPSPSDASHGYSNVHWRNTGGGWPHTVTLYNSLSDSAPTGGPLSDARADWHSGQGRINWASTTAANGASTREACADPSGANNLRVCDYNWGATGWAGRATWQFCSYGGTAHVCAGGVQVNRHYGTTYAFYRQVLCHELGHYLGLDHRSSGSSCMRTGVPIDTQYRSPDAHDFDQAVTQHDHRHTAPSITGMNKDFVGGKVTISWSGISTDERYYVYRSIDGGSWQTLGNTTSRSYSDFPGAVNVGKTLCYRVRALAEGALSPYSNGRCVKWSPDNLPEPTAPPPPYDNGDDVTPDGPPAI